MVKIETLKLLDALFAGSTQQQTQQLLALYRDAFRGTQSFRDLKDLLEGCEFHGAVGQDLLSKGEQVVKEGFTDAGNFGDRITVMDYVVEKMEQEMKAASEYLHSANVSAAALNVLDKRLAETATAYYEKLFHYLCCLYVTLYGEAALQNVNIRTGIRSADLVRNVSDELCNLLAEASRRGKPQVWRVLRTTFGGANMVRYSGFTLKYGGIDEAYLKENCTQIAPCLFRDNSDPNVLCCGIGYLTSLQPHDGGRLYGATAVTRPAMNCLDQLDMDYASLNVRSLLSAIAGSGVCVLDPRDLVELLNRYYMIRTARENKAKGCIYCGSNVCEHFRITTKFSM